MELRESPIGRLVPISGHDGRFGAPFEAEAFLPDDLPTSIDIPTDVWMVLSDAAAELGRLDNAASLIPNPQLVTRAATRQEAIGTSALEGTYAELTELFAAEVLPDTDTTSGLAPNVREVMNYARAADLAYAWISDRPITLAMLASIQGELVKDTVSDGPSAGAIRDSQVFIGPRHRPIGEARFIPPPPGDQLRSACERWVAWLTAAEPARSIPLIARVAMAHYQFETLHPFTDGNGRLGRLVAALQLMRGGSLSAPVLSLSPWLKERADAYRDHLFAVSATGEWAPWVEFFARAVHDEARVGRDRIMRLLALRARLGEEVRAALPKARLAPEIADDLIAYPVLSVADSQRRHGRSNQANRAAIASLVELGIIQPFGEARYDRMYWCPSVFAAIES